MINVEWHRICDCLPVTDVKVWIAYKDGGMTDAWRTEYTVDGMVKTYFTWGDDCCGIPLEKIGWWAKFEEPKHPNVA